MGQVPAPFRLHWSGSEAEVRAALRARSSAALPAEHATAGGLKRTVLRSLLERSFSRGADGSFEMRAVLAAQLGEAVAAALTTAPAAQQALYKTPGYDLKQLLASLQAAGLVSISWVGPVKYAAVQRDWLLQQGGPAPAAVSKSGGGGAAAPGLVAEFDLSFLPLSATKTQSTLALRLTIAARKAITGAQPTEGADVRVMAIGALLRMGLQVFGEGVVRQPLVSVVAAQQRLATAIQMAVAAGTKPAALWDCYQQQYGGSLLAVLRDPGCSHLVREETVGGEPRLLLLLDRLAREQRPTAAAASPAAPAAATLPLPIRLPRARPQQAQQQDASAASAADSLATNLATLQLADGSASGSAAAAYGPLANGAAATSVALPAGQLVTTAAAAEAAMAELLAAAEVAVDCEGDLERDGVIALVQLYAGGERCYVFDLAGMEARELPAAVGHLSRLLESESTIKVMHDCRSDCEALFYQHGIRVAPLWDTQVAFGLLQFTLSVGGTCDGMNAPVGLNQLLQQWGLPLNPHKRAMHRRMDTEPQLFVARPLDAQALEYAVADVWQLLRAKAALEGDLGPAAANQVEPLSAAYGEWGLEPGDRRNATVPNGGGSYAGAVRLLLGKTMQLSFDESQGYRPRFSPALEVGEDSLGVNSATPQAQPAELRAADDPDTQLILRLFPLHVADAILAKLAEAEEEAAAAAVAAEQQDEQRASSDAASASGSSQGGGGRGTQLVEVIVDRGRPVRVRLSSRRELQLEVQFSVEEAVEHLAAAKGHLLEGGSGEELFYSDNRAGIPGTLHRISAMRDRNGGILGLTYRVGRSVPGVGRLILDILHALSEGHDATGHEVQGAVSPSLLLLGAPGTGKTTLLRDVAHILSDTFHRNVVVVDTSNEVAGDATVPHPCIGGARRMMVPDKRMQHDTMVEATANHNPDVVIIDEIGTGKEVAAAKSIAHRGVVLVGTAHGRTLEALMRNGELNGLVGGITTVTLGDAEAKQSNGGNKTRKERAGDPAFSTLVEVESRNRWRVHMRVARSVDDILAGRLPTTQLRWVEPDGRMMVRLEGQPAGKTEGGGMRAAVAEAAGRLGKDGRWFQSLLELAAQG